MKKTSYFQIKSKIYHYYLAAVVMIFIMLGTILSIVVAREIVQSANKETTKMVYDNGDRKFDEPVYVKIANVSKVLFYQTPNKYNAEALYFEVTDTDNNKFIMYAANDSGIEKAIEIREALAKNADNEEFFVYATGATAMLSKNELKSIKEASNSPLTLDQLREKYGHSSFDLNHKPHTGEPETTIISEILIILWLLYYLISSNLKFETSRKSIGYTKQAIVQEWQNVDTKFRVCDVYPGENVIFSTEGCVLYSDILYVYEGSQKYTEPVIINPGNLVTAELKNGKRVKIGKYISFDKQYKPLLLPLIAQIKENVAKAQQQ